MQKYRIYYCRIKTLHKKAYAVLEGVRHLLRYSALDYRHEPNIHC
jgi:hypothetical protein